MWSYDGHLSALEIEVEMSRHVLQVTVRPKNHLLADLRSVAPKRSVGFPYSPWHSSGSGHVTRYSSCAEYRGGARSELDMSRVCA